MKRQSYSRFTQLGHCAFSEYYGDPRIKYEEVDSIIGSVIFEFIGASIKWFYYSVKNWLTREEHISFGKIYSGDSKEFHDQVFLGVSNTSLGLVVIIGIFSLLIYLGF